MKCKCNDCEMILTRIGWWCPHKRLAYTESRQLRWQAKNQLPEWLKKIRFVKDGAHE